MRFFSYLTGAVSLVGLVAALPSQLSEVDAASKRDATTINAALVAAQAKAVTLEYIFGNATSAADIPAIESAGDDLVAAIQNAQAVAAASAALSLIDALGFAGTVSSLQKTVDNLVTTVEDQKPLVVALDYVDTLLEFLDTLQTAVNDFGTTILTKIPAVAVSIAQGYIDDLNQSIADVITYYTT
jgi:hypothetical protein